jgi:hypothetical protein
LERGLEQKLELELRMKAAATWRRGGPRSLSWSRTWTRSVSTDARQFRGYSFASFSWSREFPRTASERHWVYRDDRFFNK